MEIYSSLTEREKEILRYISIGATNKDIADTLCISENTVNTHTRNIFTKLDVKNRYQAALYVMKNSIDELYESVIKLSQVLNSIQSADFGKFLE